MKIIAVDFDGTLCKSDYPEIIKPRWRIIRRLWREQRKGAKVILWTCREGKPLEDALAWCAKIGIRFDAVNANLPEEMERWHNDPRKIGATEFWDDKAVRV